MATKACVVCGKDVSGAKRVKDARGNYYCEGCYAAKVAERKAKGGGASPAELIDKPVMMTGAGKAAVPEAAKAAGAVKAAKVEVPGKAAGGDGGKAHAEVHEEFDEYSVMPAQAMGHGVEPGVERAKAKAAEVKAKVKPVEKADGGETAGHDDYSVIHAEKAVEAVSGAMLGCSVCKTLVAEQNVKNVGGEFICKPCHAKREAAQRAGLKGTMSMPAGVGGGGKLPGKPVVKTGAVPQVKGARALEDDGHRLRFVDTLQGGLLWCGLGVLGVFVVMVGVMFLFPPARMDKAGLGMLGAVIMGAVYWGLIMVKSGGLILSMLILAKMMGGVDFGFIGMAFFKAILASFILTLADYLGARMEGLGMIMMGLGGVLYILTFVLVFRLDMFESFLLALINFAMGWALTIAMAIMLIKVAGGMG